MKKYLVLVASFAFFQVSAQNLEFKKQAFIQNKDSKLIVPTAEEAKEKAVIVNEATYVEIANDTTNELSGYYGSYKRVHINEGAAIDRYNKIILPISSKNDLLLLKARTINADGVVKEMGKEAIKEVKEDEKVYNMLAFEGLEVNGEVEYFYLIKTDVRTFGTHEMENEIPTRNHEFKLVSPSNLFYDLKLYNGDNQVDTVQINDKRVCSVSLKNAFPQLQEKYTAGLAEQKRVEYRLLYNTLRGEEKVFSWEDAGQKIQLFYTDSSKDTKKAVEKFLKKEKIIGKTELAKIRATENYIKANIGVKEEAESGSTVAVLTNKYGSKTEIIKLYATLFQVQNIAFEFVTGVSRYKKKFDKDFESWTFLDETFFYLPNQKKYLDATNPLSRLGMFDSGFEGTNALFVGPDVVSSKIEIREIPFSSPKENYDDIDAKITFSDAFDEIKVSTKRSFGGLQSASLKGYFTLSNDEQKASISNEILKSTLTPDAVFTDTKVENYNLNNENEVDEPMILSANGTIKSMIEKAGNKIFFKLGDIIGPQVEMYNEQPREHKIDVGTAHKYDRKIEIIIPEGYKVKGLENIKRDISYSFEGKPAMGFKSGYKLEGNTLKVTIDEYYNIVLLPKTEYDNFQKVINAAADFNKVTLVLEKK